MPMMNFGMDSYSGNQNLRYMHWKHQLHGRNGLARTRFKILHIYGKNGCSLYETSWSIITTIYVLLLDFSDTTEKSGKSKDWESCVNINIRMWCFIWAMSIKIDRSWKKNALICAGYVQYLFCNARYFHNHRKH